MALIRTFVALNLPVKLIDALRAYQQRLQDELQSLRTGIRWTSPASFHMTLRFVGEVEEPLVSAMGDSLRRAVLDVEPFQFQLEGAGCFPSTRRARVLWAGAHSEGLAPLAARVEEALCQLGLPPEQRAFHPHITLGRLKTPLNLSPILERVEPFSPATVDVREVILYSSRLTPKGAIYETLRRAPLGRNEQQEA